MVKVEERLAELAKLGPDWDSYGALPLAPRAIAIAKQTAEQAVERFGEPGVPYTVMPIADGGVSLEWRGATTDLELDISPDGALSYLLIDRTGGERRYDECYDLSAREARELIARVIGP